MILEHLDKFQEWMATSCLFPSPILPLYLSVCLSVSLPLSLSLSLSPFECVGVRNSLSALIFRVGPRAHTCCLSMLPFFFSQYI